MVYESITRKFFYTSGPRTKIFEKLLCRLVTNIHKFRFLKSAKLRKGCICIGYFICFSYKIH